MKHGLNLFVLLAIFSTSLPFNSSYAQDALKDMKQDVALEMPAEAVAESEQLVAASETAPIQAAHNNENGPSCIKSGVAKAPRMNSKQRKELFVYGTITDCDGQIWKIKIIPGSDKSKQLTIESWKYAGGKTKELFKIETYSKAVRNGKHASRASYDFTKQSSKLLKKGIWDYMIVDGIYNSLLVDNKNTWVQAGSTVANLRGSFGWIFGVVYAGFLKPVTLTAANVIKAAYHVTKGTVVLVGGIAGTAGGIVATVSSPVIVPVVEVLTRPLLAMGSILTTGSIIPGAVYVWNGTAWVTSQLSRVPDSEVRINGVRFVSLTNPKPAQRPQRPQYEVTVEDFKVVVESSVRLSSLAKKQSEIKFKQEELNKKMMELRAESDNLKQEHDAHPVNTALRRLYDNRYRADVSVSEEVQALTLNDESIKEIVLDYAAELGITLSEEEVEAAVKSIKRGMQIVRS